MCTAPLLGAATGLSLIGGFIQGQSQVEQDRANAINARNAGYSQEAIQRDSDKYRMADQLAALSNRGESLSSGTPLALAADSARNAELNALSIRAKGNNEGAMYDFKASQEQQAMPFTLAGQFLNSTSKIASLGSIGGGGGNGP